MAGLLTAFTDAIADALPTITAVIGALIGVAFLFAVGRFILRRVRGEVR